MLTFIDFPPNALIFSEIMRITKEIMCECNVSIFFTKWNLLNLLFFNAIGIIAYALLTIYIVQLQLLKSYLEFENRLKLGLTIYLTIFAATRVLDAILNISTDVYDQDIPNVYKLYNQIFNAVAIFIVWCFSIFFSTTLFRLLGNGIKGLSFKLHLRFLSYFMLNNFLVTVYFGLWLSTK
jgi:hypothetical protein